MFLHNYFIGKKKRNFMKDGNLTLLKVNEVIFEIFSKTKRGREKRKNVSKYVRQSLQGRK